MVEEGLTIYQLKVPRAINAEYHKVNDHARRG